MENKIIGQGITFDDVSLVPDYSNFVPREADTSTYITRKIRLNIPVVSAAMDTVTESALAIALAQEGGLGIIHYNMTIDQQVREVDKVKRSESGVINDPVTLSPNETAETARRVMAEHNISGVPIVEGKKLVGIITRRDMKFLGDINTKIASVMTKDHLVTAPPNTSLEEAERILHGEKVEKLLLVDSGYRLVGLITMRDIEQMHNFPAACKDQRGRLRVAAAVGAHDYQRVEKLIEVGVDGVVVDSAHGHSANVIDTVKTLRGKFPELEIIAGNVTTGKATLDLIEAGASAVKVGIGPGAICTTRVIAGVGVPQITAIMDCAAAAKASGVPILADGGIRHSGDIVKAIAAGAHAVVMGSLLAGLDESPGQMIIYKGRRYKEYRGMGSQGAMVAGAATRYSQSKQTPSQKLVPEGVEGRVPYRGKLSDFIYQFVGGLRAGMGYCGTANIDALREKGKFIRVSGAGLVESHPHDITITKEAPNYSVAFEAEE